MNARAAGGALRSRRQTSATGTWAHPTKEFLKAWYGRLGYRRVRTTSMDDAYPQLVPLLATPCELAVYEKSLAVGSAE